MSDSAAKPNPYGVSANPDLLMRIPLDAKLVVDVGCGAGALGRAYRRRNPQARIVGIEGDPRLAAIAREAMDEVLELDLDRDALAFVPGSVDCLVYGDVLEHLVDPWDVLRRHLPALADDGVLLVCVPNVNHWTFTERLVRGQWRYEEMGLFDRAHLRWFTEATMREALTEAGLVVAEVAPRIFNIDAFREHAARMAPALQAMGVNPQEYARRAAPLQHIWRATRRPARPLVIIGRTLRPQAAMVDVRMAEPLMAQASHPGVVLRIGQDPKIVPIQPGVPAILILQRIFLEPQAFPYLRAVRRAGYLIIQEFDDDPAYSARIAANGHLSFAAAHAVQTSTEKLAALMREWNPEVAVMPNALAELPEPRNFRDPNRLTLFFGALNRERDVAPFLPALNAVLAEAGGRLAVEVVHDRSVFDALETQARRFTPLCDYERYKALMGSCEIAFLPLVDTRFNSMKSDLKWVEASGHGLVCIASPVVYGGSIRHGETGFIAATPEEFAACLRAILADPARAQRMALTARAEVAATRLLVHQRARRRAWYDSLWERRAELDAKLLERVPQLAE